MQQVCALSTQQSSTMNYFAICLHTPAPILYSGLHNSTLQPIELEFEF
jgi:hypothetical protein